MSEIIPPLLQWGRELSPAEIKDHAALVELANRGFNGAASFRPRR